MYFFRTFKKSTAPYKVHNMGLRYIKYSKLCLAGISQKSQPPPPPPPKKSKKSIGARPYGFKNLNHSKKPATVTQQLTKSIDFRQNYVCDCHLRMG